MDSKAWLFDLYQIVGGFVFALFAYAIMQAGAKWLQQKMFGKKYDNGNGVVNHYSNGGMTKAQGEELIDLIKESNKNLECIPAIASDARETRRIVSATDEDGVPKIHNKPSVERVIKKIWAKVSGGLNGD